MVNLNEELPLGPQPSNAPPPVPEQPVPEGPEIKEGDQTLEESQPLEGQVPVEAETEDVPVESTDEELAAQFGEPPETSAVKNLSNLSDEELAAGFEATEEEMAAEEQALSVIDIAIDDKESGELTDLGAGTVDDMLEGENLTINNQRERRARSLIKGEPTDVKSALQAAREAAPQIDFGFYGDEIYFRRNDKELYRKIDSDSITAEDFTQDFTADLFEMAGATAGGLTGGWVAGLVTKGAKFIAPITRTLFTILSENIAGPHTRRFWFEAETGIKPDKSAIKNETLMGFGFGLLFSGLGAGAAGLGRRYVLDGMEDTIETQAIRGSRAARESQYRAGISKIYEAYGVDTKNLDQMGTVLRGKKVLNEFGDEELVPGFLAEAHERLGKAIGDVDGFIKAKAALPESPKVDVTDLLEEMEDVFAANGVTRANNVPQIEVGTGVLNSKGVEVKKLIDDPDFEPGLYPELTDQQLIDLSVFDQKDGVASSKMKTLINMYNNYKRNGSKAEVGQFVRDLRALQKFAYAQAEDPTAISSALLRVQHAGRIARGDYYTLMTKGTKYEKGWVNAYKNFAEKTGPIQSLMENFTRHPSNAARWVDGLNIKDLADLSGLMTKGSRENKILQTFVLDKFVIEKAKDKATGLVTRKNLLARISEFEKNFFAKDILEGPEVISELRKIAVSAPASISEILNPKANANFVTNLVTAKYSISPAARIKAMWNMVRTNEDSATELIKNLEKLADSPLPREAYEASKMAKVLKSLVGSAVPRPASSQGKKFFALSETVNTRRILERATHGLLDHDNTMEKQTQTDDLMKQLENDTKDAKRALEAEIKGIYQKEVETTE